MKSNTKVSFHGSDLEQIAAYYKIPKESIISFGANVNPLGLSDTLRKELANHLDVITKYPDRNYESLKKTISNYCNVLSSHVVVGNGSTELISLLINQRNAKHALVIGPTYSEYERELSLTGGKISNYNLSEEEDFILDVDDLFQSIPADVDFLILCNPNNPTSSAIMNEDIERILAECKHRNIFVMIDETYVEFAPDISRVTAMQLAERYDNLMVIRGVSKFFASPGLRLGYGVTSNSDFLTALKRHQNPWSLNSIGAFAGEIMLNDKDYIQKTRDLVFSERKRMCDILSTFPYAKFYTPYANFILVRILKEGLTSHDVFEYAIKQHLMIRDCSSFESLKGEYIRFCIMNPEDNTRLMNCLSQLLSK